MTEDMVDDDNEDVDDCRDDTVADGAETGGKMEVVGRLLMVLFTSLLVVTLVTADATMFGQSKCLFLHCHHLSAQRSAAHLVASLNTNEITKHYCIICLKNLQSEAICLRSWM